MSLPASTPGASSWATVLALLFHPHELPRLEDLLDPLSPEPSPSSSPSELSSLEFRIDRELTVDARLDRREEEV